MTLIIAEAGVNHNGNLNIALELVDAAVQSGADVVKFQTFTAHSLVTKTAPKAQYQICNDGHGNQFEMLQKLQLTDNDYIAIVDYCKQKGIVFLSTAFGIQELCFLDRLGMKAIKVPSGEITNLPLLKSFAFFASSQSLPVYLSTGMSSLGEVEAALNVFLSDGIPRSMITILHCLSSYPSPYEEVNLLALQTLSSAFQCPIGFSDHTLGYTASLAAVALGASVIEKHLTLDNNMPGPDHKASLEPCEFSKMVSAIRSCELMLGDGIKQAQPSEINTLQVARRSVRACRYIKCGSTISKDDLICQRPNDGIAPMLIDTIIGTKTSREYNIGDPIEFTT